MAWPAAVAQLRRAPPARSSGVHSPTRAVGRLVVRAMFEHHSGAPFTSDDSRSPSRTTVVIRLRSEEKWI